jgi:outer membrane protein
MAARTLRSRRVWAPWAVAALVTINAVVPGCRSQPRAKVPSPAAAQAATSSPPTTAPLRSSAGRDALVLPTSYQTSPIIRLPPVDDCELRLTLDAAIGFGLDNNPRLREASAQVSAAHATASIAFAPFLPVIGTGVRYSAFNQPVLPGGAFVPASLNGGVTSFTIAEAGIQWTLYDFGRTAGHYGQAVDRARIEELSMARRQQTVAFEVAQAYFRLLTAEAYLRVEEEALRQAESILDEVQARLLGGVVQREDLLRAEVEISRVRQDLIGARQAVADCRATLNVSMGRSAQMPLAVVDVAGEPPAPNSIEACLELAVINRREIGMARQAVAAARSGEQAARGELKPKIYVRGTVLRADSPGPLNAWVEGAGIHVDQPIYAGGQYQNEIRRSTAQIAAACAGLQVVLDQVSLQVSLSYQAIATDLERIRLGEVATRQAAENLRLTLVKYYNGNATPTDVVDAQTALTQAEMSYATAIYSYLADLSQLEYALGNGQQNLLTALRQSTPEELPPR